MIKQYATQSRAIQDQSTRTPGAGTRTWLSAAGLAAFAITLTSTSFAQAGGRRQHRVVSRSERRNLERYGCEDSD
jgi:hypothetical protein